MKKIPAFILIACLVISCKRPTIKTGLEGQPLPAFNLLLTDSTSNFSTGTIPLGQPTALFYFSPHCPYCRAEMKEILQNMDELKGIRFCLITDLPFREMKHFYKEYKLGNYANITVGYDSVYAFAYYFKAQGVPYTAIYGRDKKLKGVYMGVAKTRDIKDLAND